MAVVPATLNSTTLVGAAILAVLLLVVLRSFISHSDLNKAIPSVGVPRGPFAFYRGAWSFLKNGRAVTREGYLKYPGKAFKVPLANRWLVVLNGRTLIDDLRKAPADALCFHEGTNSILFLEHTLGHE